MRTKALVLGAKPVKLQGVWVPINEAKSWGCDIETLPRGADLSGIVHLEVMDKPLSDPRICSVDSTFSGNFARAVITGTREDVDMLSIRITEKEDV